MVVRGTWAVSNAIGIWGIVCVLWALLPRLENLNEAKDADGGRGRARLSTVVSSKFDSAERKIYSTHEPLSAILQRSCLGRSRSTATIATGPTRAIIHKAVPIKTSYLVPLVRQRCAMRPTTIVAHGVITFLCAPRLQYVSSFVFGCSRSTNARSGTTSDPNNRTLQFAAPKIC